MSREGACKYVNAKTGEVCRQPHAEYVLLRDTLIAPDAITAGVAGPYCPRHMKRGRLGFRLWMRKMRRLRRRGRA